MTATCPRTATFTEQSGQFAVRNILARIRKRLGEWDMSEDVRMNIESALSEALNNVIEHAYRYEDGHPLSVTLCRDGGALLSTIVDHGHPIPGNEAPEARRPDLDVPLVDLPEGGFGWMMIHSLADEVHYEHRDSRNILTLRLPVV